VTSFQSNSQQHPNPPSNWASGFQNLNLGGPQSSPIPQSQFHHHAPLQRSKPSGWQEDFLRHQNQSSAYPLQQQQGPAVNRAYGYVGGIIPQQDTMLSPIAQQKQPERQVDDIYDEAAFERAFENARSEMHLQQTDTQLDQDLYRTEEAGRKLNSTEDDTWRDHHCIGSDRILEEAEENKDKSNDETDADELARTAGLLLENVKDDQSRKFQESSFLALMRQLRDKEIRVEGDKLVDVSMPSSTA